MAGQSNLLPGYEVLIHFIDSYINGKRLCVSPSPISTAFGYAKKQ